MMNNIKRKRKNYFIDKKFQGAFILKFCLLMGLGLLVSAVGLYLFSKSSVTTSFVNSRLSIVSTADYIRPALIWSGFLVFFAVVAIAATVFMYITHRISGALFSIERNLENIAEGDLSSQSRLRSTDQLQKMSESVTRISETLKEKLSQAKLEAVGIEKEAEKLLSDTGNNDINSKIKPIADMLKNLRAKLDYFQTEK